MLQEDRIPKIFISYAWGSSDLVLELAQRLVSHGVDVVLDKWDLKEGQDKYAFMERCVNDPEITKVLIICVKHILKKLMTVLVVWVTKRLLFPARYMET